MCGSTSDCLVKVDETGTPGSEAATGAGAPASQALDAASTQINNGLTNAPNDMSVDTTIGGWMPVIPSGSCTDPHITLPTGAGGDIPICQYLPVISLMFEMLWAALFGFAILQMISEATRTQGS